jgi:hypothetical protein
LNFKKDKLVFGFLDTAVKTNQGPVTLSNATWRAVVEWTLRKLGGKANLSENIFCCCREAQEKIKANPHWQAKVRQVLQNMSQTSSGESGRSEKPHDHHDHITQLPSSNLLHISFNQ